MPLLSLGGVAPVRPPLNAPQPLPYRACTVLLQYILNLTRRPHRDRDRALVLRRLTSVIHT